MSLLDQLNSDLKAAMLAHDEVRKSVLRSVKTACSNALVEKRAIATPDVTLSDEEVLAVLNKQAKQRRESIAEYSRGGRPDLVELEQAELAILEGYLPRQLDRQQIAEVVRQIIGQVGASGPKDMGLVMRPAMERLRGQADGKVVNEVVRELLG